MLNFTATNINLYSKLSNVVSLFAVYLNTIAHVYLIMLNFTTTNINLYSKLSNVVSLFAVYLNTIAHVYLITLNFTAKNINLYSKLSNVVSLFAVYLNTIAHNSASDCYTVAHVPVVIVQNTVLLYLTLSLSFF